MRKVKRSVAVAILHGDQILTTRRPEDDDELPGVWGLPAGTARGSETIEDVIARIGRDKLGVELTPVRKLTSGVQERPAYRLEMELWETTMQGEPLHPQWRWGSVDSLRAGMNAGSLCCELAIKIKSRAS